MKEGLRRDCLLGTILSPAQRQQHLPQLLRHDGAVTDQRWRHRRRGGSEAVLAPRLVLRVVAGRGERGQLVEDAAELLDVAENIGLHTGML